MRVTLRVKMMSIIIVKMMTGNCIEMMVVIPGNDSNDNIMILTNCFGLFVHEGSFFL